MLEILTKYRMICFFTKPHEPWLAFCFVASISISYLLIGADYSFLMLMVSSLLLFLLFAYWVVSPIYGYWASLQIKTQYGSKTLKAVTEWALNENRSPKFNIEKVAREKGEL